MTEPNEPKEARCKVPPHDIVAEESILGGILIADTALDRVLEAIGEADFYRESHRTIFRAMLSLSEKREPIDLITLTDSLRGRGELQDIGGATYLAELVDRVPSAANIANYARIVREKAVMRSLLRVSTAISERCYGGQGDIEAFLDEAERLIFDVSEKRARPAFTKVGDMVMDTIRTIEQLYEHEDLVSGVPTGFLDLDRITAGLQPSNLVIIAARPGMGKTSFALNIAQHVASQQKMAVGVYSFEMTQQEINLRLLCSEARVELAKVRTGYLGERDFPRLAMAAARLAEAPIFIDDTPVQNVLELRARARRLKREADVGLIITDPLQFIEGRPGRDRQNRADEMADIVRSLKTLAKELNIPIIALSQLNRQVELRNDRRPVMSDMLDSGSIEGNADVIMFIYRDEMYRPDSPDEGTAEVIISKQRNGPTGTVRLAFRREYTRFDNLVEDVEDMGEGAEQE